MLILAVNGLTVNGTLLSLYTIAEAPWSAAEWAGALRFVELLQAQPGRHGTYHLL